MPISNVCVETQYILYVHACTVYAFADAIRVCILPVAVLTGSDCCVGGSSSALLQADALLSKLAIA